MRDRAYRQRILAKTQGRCGYCGGALGNSFHVDHMQPIYRGRDDIGGNNNEDNLIAACKRCNLWKKTFSVDEFRNEIELQLDRLLRDSAAFRLANDFELIQTQRKKVVFYFEANER